MEYYSHVAFHLSDIALALSKFTKSCLAILIQALMEIAKDIKFAVDSELVSCFLCIAMCV